MSVTPTYPGVYIEEVPSGVRTISGVATSVTAFVGRTRWGPVNEPVTLNGFADFERSFGGLWQPSTVSFAVRDFFRNGGGRALVVRLFRPDSATEEARQRALTSGQTAAAQAPRVHARLTVNGLTLQAAHPGSWGNALRARIDHNVRSRGGSLFNLSIRNTATGETETLRDVSVQAAHSRRVDRVLDAESRLMRAVEPLPTRRPAASTAPAAGTDPFGGASSTGVATDGIATDGLPLETGDYTGSEADRTGIYALEKADLFNLLCIPPYAHGTDVSPSLWAAAAAYCERKRAMLIVDPPSAGGAAWTSKERAIAGITSLGTMSRNAAVYFPRLIQPNPLRDDQLEEFAPCGAVAGVIARTDAQRGVWKAPAGLEAMLVGVPQLSLVLSDRDNGELNPLGINCLRVGRSDRHVVWGARTLQGADRLNSEWKYIPVRRTALYIEESVYRGTRWALLEPNGETLWAQIRLHVGAFMHTLFRQGAFAGHTAQSAYLVRCDRQTTTQNDIDRGIVNVLVGFAPLRPAEFVVIRIEQRAGQRKR